LFVQTAWVDANGSESGVSPVNGLLLDDNSEVTVAMAESGSYVPPTATGWNVYLSSSQTSPALQNNAPLAIGSNWSLPSTGVISGAAPTGGQAPDFYIPISNRLRRG
jgi:fructose-specific phosphotransferase system IIC component